MTFDDIFFIVMMIGFNGIVWADTIERWWHK